MPASTSGYAGLGHLNGHLIDVILASLTAERSSSVQSTMPYHLLPSPAHARSILLVGDKQLITRVGSLNKAAICACGAALGHCRVRSGIRPCCIAISVGKKLLLNSSVLAPSIAGTACQTRRHALL